MILQELDLGDSDTDIVTVDDLSMSQLCVLAPGLKALSLSRCRWVSSCEPLKGLSRLQALDLSHTDVGPKALEALAELPALHSLNLTGCRSAADALGGCAGSSGVLGWLTAPHQLALPLQLENTAWCYDWVVVSDAVCVPCLCAVLHLCAVLRVCAAGM